MINDRYIKQSSVQEIGNLGQEAIENASVLVVGAGGLGSPILLYLTAAGVGKIGIVDDDEVEMNNLHRQVLYLEREIGAKKAVSAKANLERLNSSVKIDIFPERLSHQNVEKIFAGYDIIVDGTDNFATKYLINDAAVKFGKPVIFGSVTGFEGMVSVFDAEHGPCYRCLYPEQPMASVPNCDESGVLGSVVGIVGSMQATECLKYIVGSKSLQPLSGRVLHIDARDMNVFTNRMQKNKKCSVCSIPKDKIVLNARDEVNWDDVMFIDVRELDEWNSGHIEGAIHMPLSKIRTNAIDFTFPEFDKSRRIVAYCRSGIRSKEAAALLKENILNDPECVILAEPMSNIIPYLKGNVGHA